MSHRAREYAVIAVIAVLLCGGIAGFAFYRDEVTSYVRLQAWDLSPVTNGTRQWVQAAAKGDGATVEKFLATEGLNFTPIKKNGQITALSMPGYGGTAVRSLKALAPSADATIEKPRLNYIGGGVAMVEVVFPGKHALEFRWDRTPAGWRIIGLIFTGD